MEIILKQLRQASACKKGYAWAAGHTNPETFIPTLAQHDKGWLIWVLCNTQIATPAAMLTTLAGDADWDVRYAVARNSSTPTAMLETLAGDADAVVRRAVAQNPSTPAAMLTTLAGDADWVVRYAIRS